MRCLLQLVDDQIYRRVRNTHGYPSFAAPSGVKILEADLDGVSVTSGQVIDLYTLSLGSHVLTVEATDFYGNMSAQSITFDVSTTSQSLVDGLNRFYGEGQIDNDGVYNSLLSKLNATQSALDKGKTSLAINTLQAFINDVNAQSGKHITAEAAMLLVADAQWLIENMP